MAYGSIKALDQSHHLFCRISVNIIARVFLILALCLLSISLILDYKDTPLTKAHEVTKWSGTFKSALTIADLIVVFMALLGNFFIKRLLYVPFFVVHIQFLCALAVTSGTLWFIWMDSKKDSASLLNIVIYNSCQFIFMVLVLYFTHRSSRYIAEVREFLKESRYLDQV